MVDTDDLPCGCLISTPDRRIVSVNRYFLDALGWQPEELTGEDMNIVLNKATWLFCETYVIPMVLREGQCREVLVSLISQDGTAFPRVASVRGMSNGNFAWVFLEAENRSRLFKELEAARLAIQEQREQLEVIARTDELTGLANRRDLEISARRVFLEANREAKAVSVVILDIDRFKSINDGYGHSAGDQVICALANALRRTCRKSDIVARMGGDEFVCVLGNTDAADAAALCRRIHEEVAQTQVGACHFTVSMGIAVKPFDTEIPFADVLKLADQCLYNVKENGRNASHLMTAHVAQETRRSGMLCASGVLK